MDITADSMVMCIVPIPAKRTMLKTVTSKYDRRILVTDNKKTCRGVRCSPTLEDKQFAESKSKGVTSHFLTVFLFKRLDKNVFQW